MYRNYQFLLINDEDTNSSSF